MRKRPSGDAEGGRGSVCPARFGHIPSAFPHSRHIFLNVCDFTSEPFRREIAHSVEGLMNEIHFFIRLVIRFCFCFFVSYGINTMERLYYAVKSHSRTWIVGFASEWQKGWRARYLRRPWRVASERPLTGGTRSCASGDLCTWAGLRLQSVNMECAEAPGTREAEVAKAILPIDFCSHRRHEKFWGPTRAPPPPHPSSFHPYRGEARSRATDFTDLRTSTHTPIGF